MGYDLETLVAAVTNQACALDKAVRRMRAFYVFSDPRPGTIRERFDQDAQLYAEYTAMFRP